MSKDLRYKVSKDGEWWDTTLYAYDAAFEAAAEMHAEDPYEMAELVQSKLLDMSPGSGLDLGHGWHIEVIEA